MPLYLQFSLVLLTPSGLIQLTSSSVWFFPNLPERTRVAWISCSAEFEGPYVSIRSVAALTVNSLCFCSLIWWSMHNDYCSSQCSWMRIIQCSRIWQVTQRTSHMVAYKGQEIPGCTLQAIARNFHRSLVFTSLGRIRAGKYARAQHGMHIAIPLQKKKIACKPGT